MTVNNEIGVKQPIEEIGNHGDACGIVEVVFLKHPQTLSFFPGRICRSRGVFFHTDAAQAVGKIPINVSDWKVDLMSISGHKLYGPKGWPRLLRAPPGPLADLLRRSRCLCVCAGVGALYVRRRPRVRLEPLQSGGGQERGLRSGTVPTPLAVGLGAACSIAQQEMEVGAPRRLLRAPQRCRSEPLVFVLVHGQTVRSPEGVRARRPPGPEDHVCHT